MRQYWIALLTVTFGINAWGQGHAGRTEAFTAAFAEVEGQLQAAEKLEGLKRIGVATLETDPGEATALLKSMLTRTKFDVVLTDDTDWEPLLDEFTRQLKREDLIVADTAHKLQVQGVDAVLYGEVLGIDSDPLVRMGESGEKVTVRLLLNIASLDEANPGSLLWSAQVSGTGEAMRKLSGEERVISGVRRYRIAIGIVTVLLALFVLHRVYKRAITPR